MKVRPRTTVFIVKLMSSPRNKHENSASDDEDVLKAVMSKYKDRARDPESEEIIRAQRDWDTFQSLSAEESKALGGTQGTTHLVKGLDTELLRRQREQLKEPDQTRVSNPVEKLTEPKLAKTEMGQAVMEVLFNPERPHPHNVHHREWLDKLLTRIPQIPLEEDMPGASEYFRFGRTKYIMRTDSDNPIVVMKALADIEEERSNTRNRRYMHRMSPELLQGIQDALKHAKQAKKNKKLGRDAASSSSTVARAPVAVDDDMDIFGGFTAGEASTSSNVALEGPLFETSKNIPAEDHMARIQEALAQRQQVRKQQTEVPSTKVNEDDEYGMQSKSKFGERLDMSQFGSVDAKGDELSQSQHKRQKRGEEKQLLNQVLKKMEKLDR